MKALVTGAAGFIGSNLSTALTDNGVEVVGLDSFTDYYPRRMKERNVEPLRGRSNFRLVEAALQSTDLSDLLDGVTHVYHLAAQSGVRKSWGRDFATYTSHNIDATQRLLEALKDRPIRRLARLQFLGRRCGQPADARGCHAAAGLPAGVTKLAAEHLCGLYHTSYGVRQSHSASSRCTGPASALTWASTGLRAAHLSEPIVIYGDGEQTRDFTMSATWWPRPGRGRPRTARASITSVAAAGSDQPCARVDRDARRPPAHRPARVRPERGHARHVRGNDASKNRFGGCAVHTLESGLAAESEWLARLLAVSSSEQ
jgi:UDP-glucose 4-epimerase